MKNLKLIPILLLFCCYLRADKIEELEAFINRNRQIYEVPGVAVSVVKGNDIILAKGFGETKLGSGDKVNENTLFQLASVTKTFLAASLGWLKDQNKIDWENEIRTFLPFFALNEAYPTRYTNFIDLLTHRTGLPPFGGDLLGRLNYTSTEVLNRAQYIPLVSSFREKANYSNLGYFIAGECVSALYGKPWQDCIRQELFIPLNMVKSGFSDHLNVPNVALPHAKIDGKLQVISFDTTGGFPAAGAITSTVKEMANWMILHLNQGNFKGKQILNSDTIHEMHKPRMPAEISFSEAPPISDKTGFAFGLGWDCYQFACKKIVEKGGGLDGIRTIVTLIPELQLGITVLTNRNLTLLPEAIRAKFLQLYVGNEDINEETFELILKQGNELEKMVLPPSKPENYIPLKNTLETYSGEFESKIYGRFLLKVQNNELVIHALEGNLKGKLIHYSNQTFLLKWPYVNTGYQEVTFTVGPSGKAIKIDTETLGTWTSVTNE
ncbi:MAG: serine hydrolase [Chlamydiales bacterium]